MRSAIVSAAFLWSTFWLVQVGFAEAPNDAKAPRASDTSSSVGVVSAEGVAGETNIFGPDDRRLVLKAVYPWRVCGRIDADGSFGSGALVGPDIVLTAAHCVLDSDGNLLKDLTFRACVLSGRAVSESRVVRVWVGTTDPQTERGQDWALLLLADRLGDQLGWLGCANSDGFQVADFPDALVNAGYPGDIERGNALAAALDVKIRNVAYGLLMHDADTTRGSSGSPVFIVKYDEDNQKITGGTIYAINVAEFREGRDESLTLPDYDESHANIAIYSSTCLAKLRELRDADITR